MYGLIIIPIKVIASKFTKQKGISTIKDEQKNRTEKPKAKKKSKNQNYLYSMRFAFLMYLFSTEICIKVFKN